MERRKSKWKQIAVLVLAVLLLTTECSGGQKGKYFRFAWRMDQKFSDIEYEHYPEERFDYYVEMVRRFAEEGRTTRSFSDAHYELMNELLYVYTMMTLAELDTMADPDSEEIQNEYLYTAEVFQKLNERYFEAMCDVAASPYKEVIKECFHESYIDWFATYVPYTEYERDLLAFEEESELVREYYELMAAEVPDEERIGEIYVRLVNIRNRQAELFDFESYAEYIYSCYYGRNYLPADVETIRQGVKEHFVPLSREYGEAVKERARKLQDAENLDCSADAVLNALGGVLPKISGELHDAFIYMKDYELYDISYDPGKTATACTVRLYYYNQPFIFSGATGEFYDYHTLIHEFGHFVNVFYTESSLLFGISDNDICELQSQGLEAIMTHYYQDIFGAAYAEAAEDYQLMELVYNVIDGMFLDEFQQEVYAQENLTVEKITEIYCRLYEEYGYEPYEGYETEWMWVNHNFEMPFYYVSYGISALGALELYELSCESLEDGVDRYLKICATDAEMSRYTDLLKTVGLGDVFDPAGYAGIAGILTERFATEKNITVQHSSN